uniref:Ig-like domain-containing protein n=1 Tax=Haemonchus contortus TaxID=6289 RepID=A0A7I4YU80_HAECO
VESAARIEVYPLSAPEDRVKEQQLRQQQQYLQQQLRYEKALEREQIERKAREEENLLIREEQERLRRLFERERAERERLEQIRRREAEEREQLLRQHRLDEQDRLRRIEEENRLRQLQWAQPYQLQYQPPQQQQQQYWNQDIHPRNAQQQQFVQPSRHDVYHEQRTFAQQQQQQHQPQPAPRHFQEYHRSVPSDNQQFRQLNQYQKHIETQRSPNMPTLTPSPRPTSGPMTNGESAVSATRTKIIPGHSHEHGASLVPSRPPQFLVHPQSIAAKAGETVVFTCKTTGVPPPTLEWCRVDGTPIQSGGKFKIEHGHAGDSKLIIEKVDANDANTYAAIARNSGGTFQSRFMLNVLQARPPDAPEFTGKFQSTTIYEGDSVKLFCRATGDKVTYKWFKDNEEIKSSPPFRIENKGNETTLFIENATLAEGGWYRCDAINKFGTTALNGRVVVQSRQKLGPSHREQVTLRKVDRRMARTPVNEMQDKAASKSAPAFAGQLQPLNLIEGQTARLEFKYSPADDPNIKVVWLLNGKPIVLSSRVTTISEKGLAILEINPITVFDQGEYTVVLINPLGEARSSVVINVMGHSTVDQPTLGNSFGTAYQSRTSRAPPGIQLDLPNFHSDLRSHELFEGQPIHLEAKLTPLNDPNLVVVWYLNGRELMKNDRCHQTLNHGFATLDILNATKDDSGVFTCRAINKLGEAENQATVIVHPRVDLHKYEHNRDLDVDDVREIQFSHAKQDMVPKFLTQLQPFHCDQELGRSFFEARISPVNDPSLRVSWLKDGHALPNANRIQTFNNFGVVSLSLNPTYPDDAGTYTCVLFNANGQAQSSAELTTIPMPTLQLDTKHQDSLQIIGYLDSHQVHIGPQEVDRPEEFQSLDKPRFVRPLAARIECMENDPVHFEARLQPANDVKMTVEWYHNGAPLPAAHRFRPMFDFGYVALDILYAYPEDSGTYTLVARNELGEAQCTLELVVGSAKTLYLDPHHPEGLQRIQELEQDRRVGLPEVEDRTCDAAPQIIGNLPDLELNEHDDIHMDLKVTPVNDPTMKVEWFVNDHPIITGSRVKTLSEFGFVALDVKGAIAEDSGTYTLRVSNALGEATRQGHVKVLPAKEVVLDTHHEESLDKINYLEGLDKFPRREVEEHGPDMAPVFVVPLAADMGEVEEGEPIHLECQVKPINDNTLKVTWLRNGAPIPHGHRFRTFYDFGFVSLDILGVYPQDSGEYTCKAENALGSVETKTKISCNPKDAILGQVQHPKSYQRIQEIEAPKPKPQELPEAPKEVPTFVKQLGPAIQCSEGDNIYLEAQVAPADDNTLTYEWLVNGRPLMKAHRFVLSQDFGYIALNILYCYPEDSGTYTLVVRNAAGEAQSTVDIDCRIDPANYRDSFHPTSLQRIKELETPLQRVEPAPEKPKEVPQILKGLPPKFDIVHESQTLHLEVQVSPVDDNTLTYQWLFNGQPLKASSRYRLLNDFGYITLDIDYVIAEDAGKYTLVIENEAGRTETSTEFDVERLKSILADTAHPESLRRIQEIEQLQPAKPSEPELPPQAPVFTQQLSGPDEILKEGQSVHMDCIVQPINDPSLKIEWFCDGRPLMFGSRIRTIHDFGYVGLEFLHVHPEDTGTYVCRATNNAGQAETSFKLECKPRRNIYLDTQHESSWAKIQEMENRQEIRPPSPEMSFPPPTFTEQLQNIDEATEADAVRLDCRLVPVNDPTLKVFWTVNGQPIPEASRFMPARNFDYVSLDILGLYPEDSGVYTCKAVSDFGEAATSCTVKCTPISALMLDPQHEQSWVRVQEIENRRPPERVEEEIEKMPPKFVVPLPGKLDDVAEGTPIHLECEVIPTNDNKLTVQWFHNGAPLVNGHRFRTAHDFGHVAMDILYAFGQDSGEWTCVAKNDLGEATTTCNFNVLPRGVIYADPQHPASWERIQELEAPKIQPEEAPEKEHDKPQFLEPMESLERIEFQPAHFETRLQPVADPNMVVQWYKDGFPLHNGNRFKLTSDFGYVALDIAHTIPEDSGVYGVKAINKKGEASVEAKLSVRPNADILTDPQHDSSWQKIQQLEAPRAPGEEAPEVKFGPPRWVRQLNSCDDVIEGQPAHFEAQFEPFAHPQTTVQWYLNGRPLSASSRRILRNDFGLATLDLQYVLGEDIGEYNAVVRNPEGEDRTTGKLTCIARPSILADTLHDQSWKRIQEIEAPRAPAPEPEKPQYDKPTFTQPLQSVADIPEGGVALLEARVVPINDPNLRIQWFFNDQPLQDSNWIATNNDFGNVSLRIAPVHARHSGVYSCKATNDHGAATTSASIGVQGTESLILDTSHPASLQKIRDLESMDKFGRIEAPEKDYGKPQWLKPFEDVGEINVGDTVNLYGVVGPSDDPNLHVEWFHNGKPLLNANRFRQEFEFGSVLLTIVHVLPHDSGVFTCRAYNPQGEATTSTTLKVPGYERLMLDSQHPVSWQRIQELEAPKVVEEVEEVIQREKPHFITQLQPVEGIQEGQPIHLEATFEPTRDPDMQVVWRKNGQPIIASQLVQTHHELGWATLDIPMANEDHNGIYTVTITNSVGEAVSTAPVKVTNLAPVLGDTRHEESWRRIQILEAPREPEPEAPPRVYDPPHITTQLEDKECNEGDRVHFEAVYGPVDDPNLQVQWIRNGQPLAHGSKYAIGKDFGISTLDIAYAYPEDQGVYQVRITSPTGEAVSSATLKCHGKDAILGDTQHAESWARIQEIEAPKPKMEEVEPAPKPAPKFVKSITSPGELVEGQPAHFEATIEPADDANMEITWLLDGKPMASSSRVKMINDFGWVIMDIKEAEPRDTGEWTCVAKNPAGEARCSAPLKVTSKENIVLDSLNPQSLDRIREIEADKPAAPEAPAPVYPAPKFTAPLTVQGALEEAGSAHLQAQFTPIDDPNLKVEWLRDGKPIFHSNRYRMIHDFGFAVLDIIHLLGHDTGEYTCRIVNEAGDAVTSAPIKVAPSSGLILHPQNEQKAKAVSDLEEVLHRKPEETVVEVKEVMPVFIEPLSAPVECEEGDRAHFTARYEPLNDNKLQVQWFHDGRPLKTGSRVKTLNDFGFVVLEISPVYPEDSGEYSCRARNLVGEAVTSTRLTCNPIERIIRESQLPGKMAEAAKIRIGEIEAPRPPPEERPEADYGPPKFTTPLTTPPELLEGQMAHLEAQITPVADPNLKIEWFHDGKPMKHSNRMKMIHDFGFVVLELTPSEPQDTGKWTCRATNKKGSDEVSCDVKVVGTGGVSYEWLSPAERKDRINELEHWIHRPKEELHLPQVDYGPPKFTQNLTDLGTLNEADATAFVCVLEPIGDPTLRVHWEHNGHPIPYSNRISCTNEFGVATLLVKHLITADSGEYKCVATNSKGTAETIGKIVVESLTKVDAPQVVQPLVENIDNTLEGDSIHLECRVTPINDPQLKVQWYRNGAPLPEASRFKPVFEFGFCALDILYAYPEDNGDYELVVTNDKGEARTKCRITVLPRPALDYSSQTHRSHQDNLESHFRQYTTAGIELIPADIYDEAKKQAPVFKKPLENIGVAEGDFCRFETQLAPINDPYMKIEWFKDKKPVLLGHRFRSTIDFGFVCLDLLYALPDDTGEYTCVATNKYGQAMLTAKLACQGGSHVITESQMPQGMLVASVKKDNKKIHWTEQEQTQVRTKQPPQFTIKPRNTQVVENQPARFECALVGNPKPKVTWYINGNQALHGHRYKLNYDGLHYLTISNCRISDAGEVLVIARNSEGEVQATCTLDIFQKKDFRQQQLKPAQLKTHEELQQRQIQWQKETLGKLGEAFEAAPKPDAIKLMEVERLRAPFEPLETKELVEKFTRPRDDQFYSQLSYVETQKPPFKGMELEPVQLKPGHIERYQPPREEMESVDLRPIPSLEKPAPQPEQPDWAQEGGVKLPGNVEGRFKKLATPPKEVEVPARDQVALKTAKPKPASEVETGEHVRIAEEKARLKAVQQGPEQPKEEIIPHKQQVELKTKFQPIIAKPGESVKLESKQLKEIPPVEKPLIEMPTTISNKPQPTKIGASKQAPPSVSQQLKPIQGEPGKPAKFFVAFDGALPIKVTWFKDGKEIKSTFRHLITTTDNNSTLHIGRLENNHVGQYTARLENVAGTIESSANLTLTAPTQKGKAPDFATKLNDLRIVQNAPAVFTCSIVGEPKPIVNWFKDGQPLPNTGRFQATEANGQYRLSISNILPQDVGIYECVAKNTAGEARCKARLNVNLTQTGKGSEEGPRYEAPRFSTQIQPLVVDEGKPATFTAKFSGFPAPAIRWYRNNEPIKRSAGHEITQTKDEAKLTIAACQQEDVAEYKVEASNPAGKASSVANLVLTPKVGRIAKTTITKGGMVAYDDKPASDAPHFVSRFSDISARQGHTVKFSCDIDGNPMPTAEWLYNGKPITASKDIKISLEGKRAVLEIARVTHNHAGEYQIVIRNPKGAAQLKARLTLSR